MTASLAEFDPYYQWLGIPAKDQPANHYRLLGIELFESNPDVVANAADRQMAHVRAFQTGRHGAKSQELLNELATARLCLLNTAKKADYDGRLKSKLEAPQEATPAPSGRKLAVGSPLGEYDLLEHIGHGAIGEVFKAVHRRLRRIVAIKAVNVSTSSTEALKRFEREVKLAGMLSHPNIVAALDANESAGHDYLVMEYVPGQDLAALLQQHGPLPVEQVVDFVTQAARGLEFAHAQGVIHRNIKPGNLLVSLDGIVKILDMGLAHYDDESGQQLTKLGQMLGTVDYMSPEQASDARKADQRSDIYSLGYTMYRLLTGQIPYTAKNAVAKALAHAQSPIPPLRSLRPDAPESLERVYQRMVAKGPAERFPSMTEVIAALGTQQPATAASSSASSMRATARPRKRKRRSETAALLAVGIAALIVVGVLLVLRFS